SSAPGGGRASSAAAGCTPAGSTATGTAVGGGATVSAAACSEGALLPVTSAKLAPASMVANAAPSHSPADPRPRFIRPKEMLRIATITASPPHGGTHCHPAYGASGG